MDATWAAILTTILLAVIAGLVAHIRDDAKTKERLAKLEAETDQTREEVKSLRDRWHDLRETTLRELWNIFQARLDKLKEELTRLVGK